MGREEYRVPVYVFCDGVNDYVCAVVEGVLDVGAQESIVYHDHDAVLVGYCCYRSYVD